MSAPGTGYEDKKYVDTDAALARMRGNKKLYTKMLHLFIKSPEFGEFEEAFAQGDMAQAADKMHSIKGVTGNLSMPALFDLSSKLMQQLRDGSYDQQDISDYRDALIKTRAIAENLVLQLDAGNM